MARTIARDKDPKDATIRTVILIVLFAVVIVGFYFFINNRTGSNEEVVTQISPVREILTRDLSENYPKTPKEVVRYYCEITRCFYGEDYTDEELVGLARKSRELFDKELFDNQSEESYISALRGEIISYRAQNRVISSYSVSSSADVEYYNYLGDEWAQLLAMYSIRTGSKIEPSRQRFLLRKDPDGHWKIFGWELVGVSADIQPDE